MVCNNGFCNVADFLGDAHATCESHRRQRRLLPPSWHATFIRYLITWLISSIGSWPSFHFSWIIDCILQHHIGFIQTSGRFYQDFCFLFSQSVSNCKLSISTSPQLVPFSNIIQMELCKINSNQSVYVYNTCVCPPTVAIWLKSKSPQEPRLWISIREIWLLCKNMSHDIIISWMEWMFHV